MRPIRDETWLNVVAEVARRSTCLRRAVGCVLLNARGHVLSTGYNGRAAGLPHCNEVTACVGATAQSGTQLDACEAVHAEQNALLQCSDVYMIETCYVTVSPCLTCTKLLLNTACQRIVFQEAYAHDKTARQLWVGADREWSQFEVSDELKNRASM